MQVFGEFYGFLSLLSLWLESCRFFLSDFSSLFFSSFIIALLLKFLCSHTPLIGFAIRALGEGRRHIGRLINKPSMTLGLPWLLRFPTVIPSSNFFTAFHLFLLLTKSLFRYRLLHCLGWSHSFQDFRRKINWLLFIFPSPLYSQPSIHSFIHPSTRHTIVLGYLYISWGRHSHVLHLQLHRLFYSPF